MAIHKKVVCTKMSKLAFGSK